MCALTKAVSKPSSASSMAKAVSSDCEKKKLLSMQKNPKKNTTKASRWARSSRVLRASKITIMVTPASRPSRVRWVAQVALMATTKIKASHQWLGKGLDCQASAPRQSNTKATRALHHTGRCPTCGSTTMAITASKNRVSRLSRGKFGKVLKTASMVGGRDI